MNDQLISLLGILGLGAWSYACLYALTYAAAVGAL